MEEDAAAHRVSYTTRIEQALRSSDPDRVLEGEIAMAVAGDLVDFNRSHPDMNPLGKSVILFAPNYGRTATQAIINARAIIVRTQEELLRVLATL